MTRARQAAARCAVALAALGLLAVPAARAAEVSGIVFDDRNGDGRLGSGEPGLSGWVVYDDDDRDGVLDTPNPAGLCDGAASEPCAVSDGGGAWRLADLPAGSHQLRVVAQAGARPTTPTAVTVLLPSDDSVAPGVDFGQFRLGAVTGLVFLDADGDGQRDAGEAGSAGWTTFADADLDGRLDAGEAAAASDAAGGYALGGLAPATYAVRLRPRCGFRQTLPAPPGRYALTITSSGQVVGGRDFGSQPPPVLAGDGNGDGVVGAADLIAIARALGGAPLFGADADQDGAVTAADRTAAATNAFDCAAFVVPPTGATPTATPSVDSATPTVTPTAAPSATATASAVASTAPATASIGATAPATATRSAAPATATATHSATASTTPSPSAAATPSRTPTTPGAPADALAGTAAQIANGVSAIPAVITALVSGLEFGEAAQFAPAGETAGAGGNCPLGGTATRSCSNPGAGPTIALAFDACTVATASGSVAIDELAPAAQAVTLRGLGACPNLVLPPWAANLAIVADYRSAQGEGLLSASASLTGTVSPQLGGSCGATGATLTISGTVRSAFADGSAVSLTFTQTAVAIAVAAFNAQCVPINYTMTFNGPATVAVEPAAAAALTQGGAAEDSVDLVFDDFVVAQNATGSPTLSTLTGDVDAACAGDTLTFETLQALAQAVGDPCPQAGTLRVTSGAQQTRLLYRAGGVVGLDTDDDGASDEELAACHDAPLLCAAPAAGTPTASATRTATPLATATQSATASATRTATASATPLLSSTPTATGQASATPSRTGTATPSASATPSATATRSPSPTATRSPSPTATGTPEQVPQSFCDTLPEPAQIPDGNAPGLDTLIVVPATSQLIGDLNVRLNIAHTYVGDLRAALTHVDSARSILLLDRPGLPGFDFGCDLNDLDATFDDASLRPAEERCAPDPPWAAIDGSVKPTSPLATFAGDGLAGTWRLNIADMATLDTGALLGWCLEVNSRTPVATAFTCMDQDGCVLVVDEPFQFAFSYIDPDGDALTWHMNAHGDDGFEFDAGSGFLQNGAAGSLLINFEPFTCPSGDCPDAVFDYLLTIRDEQGRESPPQRLHVLVSVFGG